MKDDMNRREFSRRLGMVLGGLAIALIGVPLLILPGSGVVLILVGIGLIGEGVGLDVRGFLKKAALRLSKRGHAGSEGAHDEHGSGARSANNLGASADNDGEVHERGGKS